MSEGTCVYTVSEGKAADPTTATTALTITAAPQDWKVDATDDTKDLVLASGDLGHFGSG